MPQRPDQLRNNSRFLNRRQWLSILGAGSAATLAGCADDETEVGDDEPEDDDDEPEDDEPVTEFPDVEGEYVTAQASGFDTLNPLYNTEAGAGTAIGRTLDQGYTFDANGDYFPLLYDMSTDQGEVWVFEVREGLEFGDPYGQVTAESFTYQIQELHQSDWAATASTPDWGDDVNVELVNDFEFQAELDEANLLWPETFDPLEYPIPRDLVEPYVDDEDIEGLQEEEELLELEFTGNLGPFTLEEWERGSGTTYTRNDDYYITGIDEGPELFEEAPYFEGAEIRIIEEEASRLAALETGEIDAASIPPERYNEFVNMDGIQVLRQPTPFNTGGLLSVNMRDNGWNFGPGNLFRYKEFRQALASAINKRELIEGIQFGLAEEHFTWQPRFSEWYPGDDDLQTWGVDDLYGSEVARDLAEEAFEQSEHDYQFDGDDMVGPDGDQVSLELFALAGSETRIETGNFIRDELGDNLGIDVSVEAIEGVTFSTQYWSAEPEDFAEPGATDTVDGEEVVWTEDVIGPNNPGPRDVTSANPWDMAIIFGLNTYPLNPLTNEVFFDGANASYNPVGYYPGFDAEGTIQDMREATGRDELQEAANDLFMNLNEEQPYVMMVFPDDTPGYTEELEGPIENFHSGWDFPAWHFDE